MHLRKALNVCNPMYVLLLCHGLAVANDRHCAQRGSDRLLLEIGVDAKGWWWWWMLRGGGGGSSVGSGPQLLLMLLQEIGGGPMAAAAAAVGEWQGVDGGVEERSGSPDRVHGNGGNHSSSRSGLFPAAAQEARAMGLGGRAGVFKGSMDLGSELVALHRQSGDLSWHRCCLLLVSGRGANRGHVAAAAGGGGALGGRQGEVGAEGDSAAAAGAGGMEAPGAAAVEAAEFDIDELLQWSKAQL